MPRRSPPPAPLTDGQRVAGATVCLTVTRHTFGYRRKANLDAVTVAKGDNGQEADKALLGLMKTILVSPELMEVTRYDEHIDWWLNQRCVPAPATVRKGLRLLPLAFIEEVEAGLQRMRAERQAFVDLAVAAFPRRWAETQARLGGVAGVEMPSVARFRGAFGMSWEISDELSAVPQRLAAINMQIFEEERAKAAARWEEVARDVEAAMFGGLQELLERAIRGLTPADDGRPRRFHPSVVTHLTEFLRTCPLRNVTSNGDLEALAQRTSAVLQGLDLDQTKDPASRATLAASFAAIHAAIVPIVGARRRMVFDDEASAA